MKGVNYPGVTICFLCHDGKGNYLFAKRTENCRDEHNVWDAGAGGLELHDEVIDTLKKEIKEEYCTDVLKHEFLGYMDLHRVHNNVKTHWISLAFKVLVDRKKVKNGEPHKFNELGWFTLNNLPSPIHSQWPVFYKKFKDKL